MLFADGNRLVGAYGTTQIDKDNQVVLTSLGFLRNDCTYAHFSMVNDHLRSLAVRTVIVIVVICAILFCSYKIWTRKKKGGARLTES